MSVRGYIQTLLNPLPAGVRQPVQRAFDEAIQGANTYTDAAVSALGTRTITFVSDGGGSALTTGVKASVYVPYACTITAVAMLADQSGSCVVDIWKDTYASFPPTVADSITAGAKPTLSGAITSLDSTLRGWTTTINAGDTLRFKIDSVATITRLELCLVVRL